MHQQQNNLEIYFFNSFNHGNILFSLFISIQFHLLFVCYFYVLSKDEIEKAHTHNEIVLIFSIFPILFTLAFDLLSWNGNYAHICETNNELTAKWIDKT